MELGNLALFKFFVNFCFLTIVINIVILEGKPTTKKTLKGKLHRGKRDIDIFAECDLQCLSDDEVKDYDVLIEYEYEDENFYLDSDGKKCSYACKILDLEKSADSGPGLPKEYSVSFDEELVSNNRYKTVKLPKYVYTSTTLIPSNTRFKSDEVIDTTEIKQSNFKAQSVLAEDALLKQCQDLFDVFGLHAPKNVSNHPCAYFKKQNSTTEATSTLSSTTEATSTITSTTEATSTLSSTTEPTSTESSTTEAASTVPSTTEAIPTSHPTFETKSNALSTAEATTFSPQVTCADPSTSTASSTVLRNKCSDSTESSKDPTPSTTAVPVESTTLATAESNITNNSPDIRLRMLRPLGESLAGNVDVSLTTTDSNILIYPLMQPTPPIRVIPKIIRYTIVEAEMVEAGVNSSGQNVPKIDPEIITSVDDSMTQILSGLASTKNISKYRPFTNEIQLRNLGLIRKNESEPSKYNEHELEQNMFLPDQNTMPTTVQQKDPFITDYVNSEKEITSQIYSEIPSTTVVPRKHTFTYKESEVSLSLENSPVFLRDRLHPVNTQKYVLPPDYRQVLSPVDSQEHETAPFDYKEYEIAPADRLEDVTVTTERQGPNLDPTDRYIYVVAPVRHEHVLGPVDRKEHLTASADGQSHIQRPVNKQEPDHEPVYRQEKLVGPDDRQEHVISLADGQGPVVAPVYRQDKFVAPADGQEQVVMSAADRKGPVLVPVYRQEQVIAPADGQGPHIGPVYRQEQVITPKNIQGQVLASSNLHEHPIASIPSFDRREYQIAPKAHVLGNVDRPKQAIAPTVQIPVQYPDDIQVNEASDRQGQGPSPDAIQEQPAATANFQAQVLGPVDKQRIVPYPVYRQDQVLDVNGRQEHIIPHSEGQGQIIDSVYRKEQPTAIVDIQAHILGPVHEQVPVQDPIHRQVLNSTSGQKEVLSPVDKDKIIVYPVREGHDVGPVIRKEEPTTPADKQEQVLYYVDGYGHVIGPVNRQGLVVDHLYKQEQVIAPADGQGSGFVPVYRQEQIIAPADGKGLSVVPVYRQEQVITPSDIQGQDLGSVDKQEKIISNGDGQVLVPSDKQGTLGASDRQGQDLGSIARKEQLTASTDSQGHSLGPIYRQEQVISPAEFPVYRQEQVINPGDRQKQDIGPVDRQEHAMAPGREQGQSIVPDDKQSIYKEFIEKLKIIEATNRQGQGLGPVPRKEPLADSQGEVLGSTEGPRQALGPVFGQEQGVTPDGSQGQDIGPVGKQGHTMAPGNGQGQVIISDGKEITDEAPERQEQDLGPGDKQRIAEFPDRQGHDIHPVAGKEQPADVQGPALSPADHQGHALGPLFGQEQVINPAGGQKHVVAPAYIQVQVLGPIYTHEQVKDPAGSQTHMIATADGKALSLAPAGIQESTLDNANWPHSTIAPIKRPTDVSDAVSTQQNAMPSVEKQQNVTAPIAIHQTVIPPVDGRGKSYDSPLFDAPPLPLIYQDIPNVRITKTKTFITTQNITSVQFNQSLESYDYNIVRGDSLQSSTPISVIENMSTSSSTDKNKVENILTTSSTDKNKVENITITSSTPKTEVDNTSISTSTTSKIEVRSISTESITPKIEVENTLNSSTLEALVTTRNPNLDLESTQPALKKPVDTVSTAHFDAPYKPFEEFQNAAETTTMQEIPIINETNESSSVLSVFHTKEDLAKESSETSTQLQLDTTIGLHPENTTASIVELNSNDSLLDDVYEPINETTTEISRELILTDDLIANNTESTKPSPRGEKDFTFSGKFNAKDNSSYPIDFKNSLIEKLKQLDSNASVVVGPEKRRGLTINL